MINLFKMTTLLAAAALVLTGCDCFKKMAKDPSAIKVSATPEVLTLNNGKIAVDIKAEVPAKYFDKKASLKVTPVISFEGGLVAGETVLLQGECSKCLIVERCLDWIKGEIKRDLGVECKIRANKKKPFFWDK